MDGEGNSRYLSKNVVLSEFFRPITHITQFKFYNLKLNISHVTRRLKIEMHRSAEIQILPAGVCRLKWSESSRTRDKFVQALARSKSATNVYLNALFYHTFLARLLQTCPKSFTFKGDFIY